MQYKNLTVIGTSHIAKQSLKEVESTFLKENPDIIALELDKKRFIALTQENKATKISFKDLRKIGFKGLVFNLLGAWIEQKLGKLVGVKPGSEMVAAIKLAKKHKKNIALIDQDIEITLRKISSAISFKEKLNFAIDLLKGIFFKKSELKRLGLKEIDLTKVPSKNIINKIIKEVQKRYPNLYRVLIEERNQIMASKLYELMKINPEKKILAIVGAGHEEEIIKIIKKTKPTEENITYSFNVG